MTSASVSNFIVQTKAALNQEQPMNEIDNGQDFKAMFSKSLKLNDQTQSLPQMISSKPKANDEVELKGESAMSNQYKDMGSKVKAKVENTVSEEDAAKTADRVETFADKVKEVISEELDISEEEIETAMEMLGLTAVDLMDPANIAKLVLNVTGNDTPVALLMDDKFSNIMDKVGDLLNNLVEETTFSPGEIKDIIKDFEQILSEKANEVDSNSADEAKQTNSIVVTEDQPVEDMKKSEVTEAASENEEAPLVTTKENPQKTDSEIEKTSDTAVDDEEKPVIITKNNSESESKNNDGRDTEFKSSTQKEIKTQTSPIADRTDFFANQLSERTEISFDSKAEVISFSDGRTVDVADLVEQLVEQTKVSISQETTKLEMLLNPEGLGKVFMEFSQKGNEVTAKIYTQNEAVKEALENQMATLKDNISNGGGAKVTSIEVAVGTHEFERNLEEDMHNQERQEESAAQQRSSARRTINLSDLEGLQGLMTEEEQLVAKIMRENGNTVNFTA